MRKARRVNAEPRNHPRASPACRARARLFWGFFLMVAQIHHLVSTAIPALPCPSWCAETHDKGDPGLHQSAQVHLGHLGSLPVALQRTRLDPEPGCPQQTDELWLSFGTMQTEISLADATSLPQQFHTVAAGLDLILGGAR